MFTIDYGNYPLYVIRAPPKADGTWHVLTGTIIRNNKFGRNSTHAYPTSINVPVTSSGNIWFNAPTTKYPAAEGSPFTP